MELVDRLLEGDKRAAAKLISMVEDEDSRTVEALRELYPHTGGAHIVGFTGPPGTGKSTLISHLIKEFRSRGKKVGVVAVDPTSPISGGALLGDRVRMRELGLDDGVFIRSMATRGHLGGLARAAYDAVKVLDAFGMDLVMVETVGAGQSEVEIASLAHTTVIVEVPGLGDAIQTIKAGILEVGDVFVANKVDMGEGEYLVNNLRMALEGREDPWEPPILQTVATEGEGVPELADALEEHWSHLSDTGELEDRDRQRLEAEILDILQGLVLKRALSAMDDEEYRRLVDRVCARETDPRTAAERIAGNV
jgi:LAO/AO transport system kinase